MNVIRYILTCIFLASCLAAKIYNAAAEEKTDQELSANLCESVVEIVGLKATPGNYLAMRTRPGVASPVLDKLQNGEVFRLCEVRNQWIKVLIENNRRNKCLEMKDKQDCQFGWIYRDFTRLIAG